MHWRSLFSENGSDSDNALNMNEGVPQCIYRNVSFGTRFSVSGDARPAPDTDGPGVADGDGNGGAKADVLCVNEVAADVGGVCMGADGEGPAVLDHHFAESRFPSATAAVLGSLPSLGPLLARLREQPVVYLVTHKEPDFDAHASLYLLRCLVDGTLPDDPSAYGSENGPTPSKRYSNRTLLSRSVWL